MLLKRLLRPVQALVVTPELVAIVGATGLKVDLRKLRRESADGPPRVAEVVQRLAQRLQRQERDLVPSPFFLPQ